ncbi:N-formylglutamate amidohydrolase [Shumkonia mesophila]|uniref:N-formylglutamate amidohydrolase n=1 Tax=Shumkonia mesophila TaxID=2838854 RepID=UPI00293532B0|nr:N-formylglutamate amidohydrolase [Shumkonia mesophila]
MVVMDASAPKPAGLCPLLGADDPAVAEILNPDGRSGFFLLACHAGRAIPRSLGTLGLDEAALAAHIGWDIGAADIVRRLSPRLDAPAVLATYSRLAIDLNRLPGAIDSIPAESDGTAIPGNRDLGNEAREQRIDGLFWPYHNRVAEAFASRWNGGRPAALIAIHTFTPCLNGGLPRPWEAGLLWNRDDRLARPLIRHLQERNLCVGDNQPYSGRSFGFSMDYHAGDAGVPHVGIEIRQDLVDTPAGAERWAALIEEALLAVGPVRAAR